MTDTRAEAQRLLEEWLDGSYREACDISELLSRAMKILERIAADEPSDHEKALERIATGDFGTWKCDCPACEIATGALPAPPENGQEPPNDRGYPEDFDHDD